VISRLVELIHTRDLIPLILHGDTVDQPSINAITCIPIRPPAHTTRPFTEIHDLYISLSPNEINTKPSQRAADIDHLKPTQFTTLSSPQIQYAPMAGIKRTSQDDQYTPRGLQNSSKRSKTSLVEYKSSYTPTSIKQRPLHQRSAGFWDYVPGFVKDILCRSPDVTSCKLISPVAIAKLKWDRYAITKIRSSSLVIHGFTQCEPFFSTTRRLKGRKCEW